MQQPGVMRIETPADLGSWFAKLNATAAASAAKLAELSHSPSALLKAVKFDAIGHHPFEQRRLNFIEQVNQHFSALAALKAVEFLFRMHPDCGPLLIAPGNHGALPLDVMSVKPGLIGAESFAALTPRSNQKISKDVAKLAKREEYHRYALFLSPKHPEEERLPWFEVPGVQVWALQQEGR